ncbi:MAG: hypothetical protein ACOCRD_05290 [Halorubrum sp.]
MRDRLTSDLGVYALSGLFSLIVFGVALALLSRTLPDGLGSRQLVGLVVGYLLFMGVYTVAWFMYTEIDSREEI